MPDPSEAVASGVEDEFPPVVEEPEMFDDNTEESFDEEPEIQPIQPPAEPEIVTAEEPHETESDTMVIRVLEDLPPFAGPDRDYELHKEDIVTLPKAMAAILVNSQKAVEIAPSL